MPPKETLRQLMNKIVKEFEGEFSTDGSVLFCQCCQERITCEQKSQVIQHRKTKKHISYAAKSREKDQCLIAPSTSKRPRVNTFNQDFCAALVESDIPFNKVNNAAFRSFLEKYTGIEPPDESHLRKYYLPKLYEDKLAKIREVLRDARVWVSVDETTDSAGRYIANVIVGELCLDKPGATYLLTCEQLPVTNSATIAQLILSALQLLWPQGTKYNNVLLFLSDAAAYMKKAVSNIQVGGLIYLLTWGNLSLGSNRMKIT